MLWNHYVWHKQSLKQLSQTFKKSIPTIQKYLDLAEVKKKQIQPQKIVLIADVTFFGRGYGILVFRSEKLKKNILWKEVENESPKEYRELKEVLEKQGFIITAVILDGRKGVREVFSGIPIQMCHFHQKQILRRYLTQKPKLEAGRELKSLSEKLSQSTEEEFRELLSLWYKKWEDFLKEKTLQEDSKKWHYTHRKMRSAYYSLTRNLPYLFTYQKYPELQISKTTNSLDGSFGHLKTLLKNHRGLTKERRFKVIEEILGK